MSKYNILVDHPDGKILYNQISGGLIVLDDEEYKLYSEAEAGCFNSTEFTALLKEGGYIIENNFNEKLWMESVYLAKTGQAESKSLTITPTDRCNLDCVYCYEHKNDWKLMSEETQSKVEEFTNLLVRSSTTKILRVTWFGGEPLLHLSCVERLSKYFQKLSEEIGFKYDQNMITNGTLLTANTRKTLKEIGCRRLQITVDGIRGDHDTTRPFRKSLRVLNSLEQEKSGCGSGCGVKKDSHAKSSFDKIMEFLPYLKEEGFTISIRVNVNENNIDSFWKLAEQFSLDGLLGKDPRGGSINIYPARIFEHHDLVSKEKFAKLSAEATVKYRYNDISNDRILNSFTGENCMTHQKYALGISQNGSISKCWRHITNEEYVEGSIDNLDFARHGIRKDFSPIQDPECSKCKILPTCWGGCLQQNKFWQSGYAGEKYAGCDSARWDINLRVVELYEKMKGAIAA